MNMYKDRDATSVSSPLKPCSQCRSMTSQEALVKYGSMCGPCFQSYCRQAPAYMPELDKYRGDSRGWAKRIVDKHQAGIHVNQIALKMAQEVL